MSTLFDVPSWAVTPPPCPDCGATLLVGMTLLRKARAMVVELNADA